MGDTETVIFESCQNKEAAFEWVSYLAAGEGQKMWCEGTGNVPVSKTVQAGDFFQSNRFMKASIDGQSYAASCPSWTPQPSGFPPCGPTPYPRP